MICPLLISFVTFQPLFLFLSDLATGFLPSPPTCHVLPFGGLFTPRALRLGCYFPLNLSFPSSSSSKLPQNPHSRCCSGMTSLWATPPEPSDQVRNFCHSLSSVYRSVHTPSPRFMFNLFIGFFVFVHVFVGVSSLEHQFTEARTLSALFIAIHRI